MVEVEEIELDLGLSIGGAFKKSKPESQPDELISSSYGVGLDQNQQAQMKREIQALRRMEVKRKRVQKREPCPRAGDLEPECEQVFKREKTEIVNDVVSWMTPFQVVQPPPQLYETLRYGLSLPLSFGSEKNEGRLDGVSFNRGDGKVKSNGSSRCSSSVVSDYQSSSREGEYLFIFIVLFNIFYRFFVLTHDVLTFFINVFSKLWHFLRICLIDEFSL